MWISYLSIFKKNIFDKSLSSEVFYYICNPQNGVGLCKE